MIKQKGTRQWQITFRRIRKNKLAITGGTIIILLILTALFAPIIANDKPILMKMNQKYYFPIFIDYPELREFDYKSPNPSITKIIFPPIPYSPIGNNLDESLLPPGSTHLLGTDENGRDVLSRIIYGSRVSLRVGIISVGIAVLIGIYLGAIAGYYGGWVDYLVSRFIEIMICFPFYFLVLAVMALLEPGINKIMIVIGITSWTGIARLVRGEFLKFKSQEFVVAAQTLGTADWKIIFGVSEGDAGCPEGRQVSSEAGPTPIHPERGREAATAGDTDGTRPRGSDGGETGHRADFRGGL